MKPGLQRIALELAEAIRDQDWRMIADVLADLLNEDRRYEDGPEQAGMDSQPD